VPWSLWPASDPGERSGPASTASNASVNWPALSRIRNRNRAARSCRCRKSCHPMRTCSRSNSTSGGASPSSRRRNFMLIGSPMLSESTTTTAPRAAAVHEGLWPRPRRPSRRRAGGCAHPRPPGPVQLPLAAPQRPGCRPPPATAASCPDRAWSSSTSRTRQPTTTTAQTRPGVTTRRARTGWPTPSSTSCSWFMPAAHSEKAHGSVNPSVTRSAYRYVCAACRGRPGATSDRESATWWSAPVRSSPAFPSAFRLRQKPRPC
jgi:hypothetical protein